MAICLAVLCFVFFTYKVNMTLIIVKDKIYHSCAYKNRMA